LPEQLQRRIKEKYPTFRAAAVTGETGGDEERKAVIEDLVEAERRVLVATDCLSEGINLQDDFDAVLHFDLPWNPNRLEQREGRVDRFGQKKAEVCAAAPLWCVRPSSPQRAVSWHRGMTALL
jgi:superfamily II DNA/RNA helicase